jgi:hypothetical protein
LEYCTKRRSFAPLRTTELRNEAVFMDLKAHAPSDERIQIWVARVRVRDSRR